MNPSFAPLLRQAAHYRRVRHGALRRAVRAHRYAAPWRAGPVYLFDLDNTLFNASLHVFPRMNRHINAYLMRHLHLEEAEANRLRIHYWRRFGTTLHGLMAHHVIDPLDYLRSVHPEELVLEVRADLPLRRLLLSLPGRKFVFTNSIRVHAERVLTRLGVADLFEDVFDVVATGFHPKPSVTAYRHILRRIGVPARACVMVEDTLANLVTAKRLGMGTIYIHPHPRRSRCADRRLRSIYHLSHRF